ncbi:unnamed protein product, partial [Amoebophrya sp. A120]|eukprot:GSA120T00024997001.1
MGPGLFFSVLSHPTRIGILAVRLLLLVQSVSYPVQHANATPLLDFLEKHPDEGANLLLNPTSVLNRQFAPVNDASDPSGTNVIFDDLKTELRKITEQGRG